MQQQENNKYVMGISDVHLTVDNYMITIMLILSMVAIFLSFKCNAGKFNLLDFLCAIMFAPLYIPIRLGMSWNKCFA